MALKDLIRKKETVQPKPKPELTILRTTTDLQEVIEPPSPEKPAAPPKKTRGLRLRRSWHQERDKDPKRLKEKLSFHRETRPRSSSAILPRDLPDAPAPALGNGKAEAEWEERATVLAQTNPVPKAAVPRTTAPPQADEVEATLQEGIRLHEEGELNKATAIFHQLADSNHALAQVLYGLALRHGWGTPVDTDGAIRYLSLAASNSAMIEKDALTKGGAKGELVLAIFELGNCFRHGWGIQKDPAAARHYYETAANLGDPDAMEEAAWCYLDGFGGRKDKFAAARFLREAEKVRGRPAVGNSWIWKNKYNP
ncbi:HCP-like protein [Piedraia hortae CBS 480.64]|uniref:HCP-like protein n=1 Tax=Piedraia hortae CBS 480.64 TaxID=1314780 RepID=A0A6A7BRT4_9PEZI|nr:HCP-like protein [Piedraia hortae CBS 480.64]